MIVGAAVGGVAVLAIFGFVIFFVVRSARRRKATYQPTPQQAPPDTGYPPSYMGNQQPELQGTPVNGAVARGVKRPLKLEFLS